MLKGAMKARSTLITLLAIVFMAAPLANCGQPTIAQKQKITSTVLEQLDLGNLPAGDLQCLERPRDTTFQAGSTYFAGAGEDHPPGEMSAKNVAMGALRATLPGAPTRCGLTEILLTPRRIPVTLRVAVEALSSSKGAVLF